MATWQLQEAKARLSEVIETAKKHGPQVITQRGVQTAVLIPFSDWATQDRNQNLTPEQAEDRKRKEFLTFLQSAPEFEIPDRHRERSLKRKVK